MRVATIRASRGRMIELKDVLGWLVGSVGFALAAYQYWRNEWTKYPLALITAAPFADGVREIGGQFVVRNRGPWDVQVETIRASKPKGAMMVMSGPPRLSASGSRVFGPESLVAVRHLGWKLPAYASGDFPSESHWFKAVLPEGSEPRFVEIELVMKVRLSTMSVKRLTVRHKIKRVKSKTEP